MLVVVTDSAGQTLYLDNRYRFKGPYRHRFDLGSPGKGTYRIEVIRDAEHTRKKITIH
jgi:hypothetical protein